MGIKMDHENNDNLEITEPAPPQKRKPGFGAGFLCGLICCLFVVAAGFGAQYLFRNVIPKIFPKEPAFSVDNTIYNTAINERSLEKLSFLEDIIRRDYFYYDDLDYYDLEVGLYRGLIASLGDPYAAYYTAEELIVTNANLQGVTYGIGAYISYDEDRRLAVITGFIEGGSAIESELREGDFIVKVDDVDVTDYTSTQVVSLVRGQENTPVQLTIFREGVPDYIVVNLIRKKALENETIHYGLMDDERIGYIYISRFEDITISQFEEALTELKDKGIEGLIIDLRNNPGGNLSAVTAIARSILPQGLIVYTEDSHGERDNFTSDGRNELQIPLTVLVNEYSASASEILAGAIQDHQKGVVVGTTTYGKGSVQRIINLSDHTAVKLTVSAYFTPLGRNLGHVGITPDIEIELDREAYYAEDGGDNQLDKAVEVLQGMIEDKSW
jgi:carboxyl-terminal processing protease